MNELFTGKRRYAVLLVVVFVLTGIVENYLVSIGYGTLATIVFILGYGHVVIGAWYIWLRPLEMTGPVGDAGNIWDSDDDSDNQPEKTPTSTEE
ncbi:hypothetical protein [Halonotius terrestris]|jgi:hypothetical protein|uniref:hypothetical protein n=1 Tax=Halonotius terrestris TaxID=2487750 RepID=UPI00115E3CF1|nr:hypothetical protein [Halonotius terrestris]